MVRIRSLFQAWLVLVCLVTVLVPTLANSAETDSLPSTVHDAGATLKVFNRDIVTFRSTLMGISSHDRALRAKARIEDLLDNPGPHKVEIQASPLGSLVQIDGATSFIVTADDADTLQQESLEVATRNAVTALAGAIEATRESRSLDSIVRSVVVATIATVVFLALLWGLRWVRRAIERWLVNVTQAQTDALRAHGVEFVRQDRMIWFARTTVKTFHRILILLLVYEWVSLVLGQFPYTQVWSAHLNGFLLGLVGNIGTSILNAVPGILTALVIFFIARFVGRILDNFFDGVRTGQTKVSWLDPEVAMTTRRITKAIVWLFAFAMAYPYLPGSHTDAFKGVSVLVGLMISLGASNLIGQAGSGLILTYARVFRRGEYVSIGDHEGTITDLGMFATRLLTGQGEELTLSNSLVLGAVTKNYSRTVNGPGYILEVTATIGYDTPWRQVHAMLIEGARRTPGVLANPAPQVFQMSLSDFYPEYRLVCQAIPTDSRPRVVFLSALHANIQDVFNEFGVQIMSPHYFKDPQDPKIVPQNQWFTPPAQRPDSKTE